MPLNLSGEWDITEVEDKKQYRATLDAHGNGPYTWQGGRIVTTQYDDRHWQGTWTQTENDREGAFEVALSEDGTEAKACGGMCGSGRATIFRLGSTGAAISGNGWNGHPVNQ